MPCVERVLFAPRELPALPPDVAQDPTAYADWARGRETERRRSATRTPHAILHLVMIADRPSRGDLQRTLEGLRRQLSRSWRLSILTSAPSLDDVGAAVRRCLPLGHRRRVRPVTVTGAPTPLVLLRHLQEPSEGGVALIHPGDVWAPDAVGRLGSALTPRGVVYADEDEPAGGAGRAPRFKPAYSPDFLLSTGYVGRPMVLGSEVAQALPPLVATQEADLDHDLALAACEIAESVGHIAEVLCHRSTPRRSAARAVSTSEHVTAALRRRVEDADASIDTAWGTHRIIRRVPPGRSVSIIVPFRDEPRFLRTCVDSVTATTKEEDVELVLVDNGSSDPEVLTLVDRLDARADVRIVSDPRPFNWAQLNNDAARRARGEVLVFLNNDIEAHRDGWLQALMAQALRPDVGAVGARLLYPDRRVQHCGVVVGLIGAAGHPLIGLAEHQPGYMDIAVATRECAAVTGACLATRRDVFEQLEGFDETLGVDLNDVDFCLRAGEAGLRTVYEPMAELTHYESPSRGTAGGAGDIVKFIDRWTDYISAGDPYFNEHLTRTDASCRLASPHEEERWKEWYATLTTVKPTHP